MMSLQLKRVAKISYGLGQPPPLSEAGIPILRATNIQRGNFVAENLIRADLKDLPLDRASLLSEGEILVVRSGAYTGDSALVTKRWAGSAPGYDLRVTPISSDPRYLSYSLLSSLALDQISIASSRAAQPHLNAEELGEVRLRFPATEEEQQRIADFLDAETARIDDLCRLSIQQTEVLLERLTGEMRSATVGASDDATPTGIPWMPLLSCRWRLGKVAHLFRTGSGTTPTAGNPVYFDGNLPWINSANVNDGVIQTASRHITPEAIKDFSSLKKHPKGSLVIAMYGQGETKGRVAILGMDAYVNQACCVLSPLGGLSVNFAYFWFRAFREGVISLAFGAGQPNLSQDLIRAIRIPVPDPESQRDIIRRLAALERQVAAQRRTLVRRTELLRERRQALITAAVTGQFDVTTGRGADLS